MPFSSVLSAKKLKRVHHSIRERTCRKTRKGSAPRNMTRVSPFLGLPAEIRNLIYAFAACSTASERCSVAPSLNITQTCRQIRYEYLPICLSADITIDWRDVPPYFELFFPTQDGKVTDSDLAPERMNIYTNYCLKTSRFFQHAVAIDILPMIKLSLANKDFACNFIKCSVPNGSNKYESMIAKEQLQNLHVADTRTLQKLLAHRNSDWIDDILTGKIRKLTISQIGTNRYPEATFFVGSGHDRCSIPEFADLVKGGGKMPGWYARNKRTPYSAECRFDEYVKRVGLREVFLDNEYVFLWSHDWVRDGRRGEVAPPPSPVLEICKPLC